MDETLDKKLIVKEAIRMAWPAVLESFFVSLAGMIDTMMVSNLGTYAISSVGLTTQPKFVALALFVSMNIAVSALVARRYGQKDQKNANQILYTALTYTVICAIIVTFISVYFASDIIRLCGSNADTHDSGTLYFTIIQAGMIFNVLSLCINAAQRGSGNTKIAMRTNVTSSIINVIFNFLLIEGRFGFPRLELFGAALATVLGTVVACIMSIISLTNKNGFLSFQYIFEEKIKPGLNTLKSMISLSINFLIENLAMRIGFLTTAIIAAKLGTDAFAAHQVGMNFLSLSFSFGDGMQVAAVALIGRSLGRKRGDEAKAYGKICQQIGLCISLVLMSTMFLYGKDLFSLFFEEGVDILDTCQLIANYIAIICIFQISQVVYGGSLRGAGDVKYTLFASLISVTIIRSLVTYLLTGGIIDLGISGIWIGILSDQFSRFVLLSTRYHQGKWVDIRI